MGKRDFEGSPVRVVLTNEFGAEPLALGKKQIALSIGGSEIDLASAEMLTLAAVPPPLSLSMHPSRAAYKAIDDAIGPKLFGAN